jgi:hypothetical protein
MLQKVFSPRLTSVHFLKGTAVTVVLKIVVLQSGRHRRHFSSGTFDMTSVSSTANQGSQIMGESSAEGKYQGTQPTES